MEHVVVATIAGPVGEVRVAAGRPGDPRPAARRDRTLTAPVRVGSPVRRRRLPWPNARPRSRTIRRHTGSDPAAADARRAARAPPRDAATAERGEARQPGARGRHRAPRPDRGRGRPHRAGDGPAARLTRLASTSRCDRPDLRGRAARRPPERGDADPDRDQGALHRAARRGRPARDRGDQLRRRRARSRSWPTRTTSCADLRGRPASATRSSSRTCAAWPAPRPPAPTRSPSSPRRPTRSRPPTSG